MVKQKATSSGKKQPLLSAQLMDEIDKKNKASSPSDKSTLSVITLDEDESFEKKKGHKLFFFCCDSKRAVIVLNTIVLMVNIMALTVAIRRAAEGYEKAIVVRSCGMFVTITTILGAYWYSKTVVLVGLAFTCYMLTVAIIKVARHNWDGGYNEDGPLDVIVPVFWHALIFYAEAVFISECNDGIMSPETYKRRERYSCCCNC